MVRVCSKAQSSMRLPRKEDVELLHHLVPPAVLTALNDHHYLGTNGTYGTFLRGTTNAGGA